MEPADTLTEVILRVVAAVVCGGVLGWEREQNKRPAGLRTHMMVALGGAAFTLLALKIYFSAEAESNFALDPQRAVQGVIGGIGFLGAGSIIQSRGSVRGVTTAATIWVVGSIGVACGAGFYQIGVTTVITAFVILAGVGRIEELWMDKPKKEQPVQSDAQQPPATPQNPTQAGID